MIKKNIVEAEKTSSSLVQAESKVMRIVRARLEQEISV